MSPWFEDQKLGDVAQFGAHTFTREGIIAFALLYDPQPFHLSDEGARASIYGGLIASGWHTAGICMRLMVDRRDAQAAERVARGEPSPRLGVSPGFKNMRWLAPVRPGDTIAYSSRVEFKRETKKPEWGLVSSRMSGVNQHGAEVFAFEAMVFWPRRQA